MSPSTVARLRAPAKVNLLLRVLARRPDGFHGLETLFQAVGLFDDLRVAPSEEAGVRLRVDGPDVGPVAENLAARAARAFLVRAGLDGAVGAEIHLVKRIPAGAGLGGGSSDAAATLRCMDALWPGAVEPGALTEMAAALGSDVPFFLGPAALALGRGRGEVLEALEPLPVAHLVLVLPPVHVSTGGAYAALARSREGGAGASGEGPPPAAGLGSPPGSWAEVAALATNDFEAVVPGAHPPVAASLAALRRRGAHPALLSGSGGACFGAFPSEEEAAAAARGLGEELGWPAMAVPTLPSLPAPELGVRRGG